MEAATTGTPGDRHPLSRVSGGYRFPMRVSRVASPHPPLLLATQNVLVLPETIAVWLSIALLPNTLLTQWVTLPLSKPVVDAKKR